MYQSSSGHKTKHAYDYMNSEFRNALLIIMKDRSFELSANCVYVRDKRINNLILHWLIESIPEGFWSLFLMPAGGIK